MLDELRFRLRVSKVRRAEKKQIALNRVEWRKKHGDMVKPTSEQLDELIEMDRETTESAREEIADLQTWHLLHQTDKLLLPQPDFNARNKWIWPKRGGYVLTSEARAELRDVIRKERKERSEVMRLWFATIGGIIGALTGVIGATIGLLAYLDKLHH